MDLETLFPGFLGVNIYGWGTKPPTSTVYQNLGTWEICPYTPPRMPLFHPLMHSYAETAMSRQNRSQVSQVSLLALMLRPPTIGVA